jgi:hypothetical protein
MLAYPFGDGGLVIRNHQYQLFAYLKMLGVPLGTRDLYIWRGR